MMLRRAAALLLLVVALALPGGSPALADDAPPSQQALLLLRILAYDRELKTRSGGKRVVVAVAYRSGDRTSEDAQSRIFNALEDAAARTTVMGMQVGVIALPVDGTLEDKLASARPAALYVCPGLEEAVAAIAQVTRRRSVLSLAARPDSVKNGLAVGFEVRGSRTAVLVNLAAARAEGVDFELAFLRIAEVIKP